MTNSGSELIEVNARDDEKLSLRRAQVFGGISLAWLVVAISLVVYGVYLVSGERVTNRTLLFAVGLAGAGGATLGAAVSLTSFLARSQYKSSWTPYYILRPILGGLLGIFVYVGIRGVYISNNSPPEVMNLYGVLSGSFACGLLSKQVLDRLSEISQALIGPPVGGRQGRGQVEFAPRLAPVDRYRGYIIWKLKQMSEKGVWRLSFTASPRPEGFESAHLLDFGEGHQPPQVRLGLTILSHNATEAGPATAIITASAVSESKAAEFFLAGITGEPNVIVEISQRGRTVGSVTIGRPEL